MTDTHQGARDPSRQGKVMGKPKKYRLTFTLTAIFSGRSLVMLIMLLIRRFPGVKIGNGRALNVSIKIDELPSPKF